MRIVNPTISIPYRQRLAEANTLKELRDLHTELLSLKIFDPACGSGNFLYVAYRELKRIETDLLIKMRRLYRGDKARLAAQGHLSILQFYGFDVLPFAVELAKVTLLFAKELALMESRLAIEQAFRESAFSLDAPLPLDNLDGNLKVADALFEAWPNVDIIIGNPPFQSKNKMQKEFGPGYFNRLRKEFPNVPGRADYCVYFFHKTHKMLKAGMRAGLVGTNTISQNYSREGGLDYIVNNGGEITEAVASQKWSGDAVVHVAIVNWIKGTSKAIKKLSKQFDDGHWESKETLRINSSLSFGVDVTAAKRLAGNLLDEWSAQGQTHGHEGFLLESSTAQKLIKEQPMYADVVFPFLTFDDLITAPRGTIRSYVIDLHPRDFFSAQKYPVVVEKLKKEVLPHRIEAAAEEKARNDKARLEDPSARVNWHHKNFHAKWWLMSYPREGLISAISKLPRYLVCGQVTKRPIFDFVSSEIRPNASLIVFPAADDYTFGILQSDLHWSWFTARCSTLKSDPRYTSSTVFDTFPWPQEPTPRSIRLVAEAARALRMVRDRIAVKNDLGLREMYQLSEQQPRNELKSAHFELERCVREAYGFSHGENALDLLLHLNHECAIAEQSDRLIVGPGLPVGIVGDDTSYVTRDCLNVPQP